MSEIVSVEGGASSWAVWSYDLGGVSWQEAEEKTTELALAGHAAGFSLMEDGGAALQIVRGELPEELEQGWVQRYARRLHVPDGRLVFSCGFDPADTDPEDDPYCSVGAPLEPGSYRLDVYAVPSGGASGCAEALHRLLAQDGGSLGAWARGLRPAADLPRWLQVLLADDPRLDPGREEAWREFAASDEYLEAFEVLDEGEPIDFVVQLRLLTPENDPGAFEGQHLFDPSDGETRVPPVLMDDLLTWPDGADHEDSDWEEDDEQDGEPDDDDDDDDYDPYDAWDDGDFPEHQLGGLSPWTMLEKVGNTEILLDGAWSQWRVSTPERVDAGHFFETPPEDLPGALAAVADAAAKHGFELIGEMVAYETDGEVLRVFRRTDGLALYIATRDRPFVHLKDHRLLGLTAEGGLRFHVAPAMLDLPEGWTETWVRTGSSTAEFLEAALEGLKAAAEGSPLLPVPADLEGVARWLDGAVAEANGLT